MNHVTKQNIDPNERDHAAELLEAMRCITAYVGQYYLQVLKKVQETTAGYEERQNRFDARIPRAGTFS